MPIVKFVLPDGTEQPIDVPVGWSLMEAARREGIEGIVAECGGGAICGTCHVHVDPEHFSAIAAPDMSESALLQIVPDPSPTSRLSCQIIMTDSLAGMSVRIPVEQLML
ncbi:2Fe-2S iron-sulfur cluster binding domain-containing protein [Allopusillimonas soli]|uniref:2Fe-2S iron-sulfur cluster binding domain-containing protein n=1 Tax=Allopusillimonas soli TaxID=659016 RepID=A0A853FFV6_9BURK|nr:2Fe-2S iron-sulfur cluster-binding protein [Allopusillimonas soli]NYT38548.1 2Fe-2S iron-sulfur cluster binding domain-containing protein [Allopusillimonas soli]TEA71737.1 2Fe-2S iron-sulfur cluster binding domain-containing protein [Allopusillimonas soli]